MSNPRRAWSAFDLMSLRIVKRLGIVGIALVALMTPAAATANEADDEYAVAAGLYSHQQWRLAAEEFERFLRENPQHAHADQSVFFLAESLLELRRFGEAAARYREYLDRSPTGAFTRSAQFRAGEAAYLGGDRQTAQRDLERFRDRYPHDSLNAYVLPYLGEIALTGGDLDLGVKIFEESLRRFPEGALQDDCRFGIARAREKQGKTELARHLYMALAAKTGSSWAPDAQFHLASLEYAAGNNAEAARAFEAFESRFPQNSRTSNARLGRGWALFKLDRFDEARKVFTALAAPPGAEPVSRYWQGLAEKALGDYAAAAATLTSAAAAAPNDKLMPAIRFHAGDALLHVGKSAAAVEQFDLVLSASDVDPEWLEQAVRGKIQAALETKDHPAVEREVSAFEARYPRSVWKNDVQRMRARSLLERKEYSAAVEVLERLIGTNTTAADEILNDHYLIALGYEGMKRYKDALDALLTVIESANGQLKRDSQLAQGTVLLGMNRPAEAIAPLEASLAGKPSGERLTRTQAALAIAYTKASRGSDARRVFGELAASKPRSELLTAVTEQLSEAAYDAGDTAWATELFGQLAGNSHSPQHELKGLSGQAWSRFKSGQLPEAAELFDRLLKKDPPSALAAEAALARGQVLEQLGRLDPALLMYDTVVERYAKSAQYPQALLAAARLRCKLHQYPQAIVNFERLAEKYPQLPHLDDVLYEWAWALEDSGKSAEAVNVLERLYREHRETRLRADVAYRLASRRLEAKDYVHAGELAAEVLKAKPEAKLHAHALYLQGQVEAAQENWAGLQRAMQTLCTDFPKSDLRLPAAYWLAEAFYRQGDYDAAGKYLEHLAGEIDKQQEPWQGMILLRRAQVLAHQRNWNEAERVARKIEKQFPAFAQQYEVDYVIGRCRASLADFEGARQAYQKVIRSTAGAKTETAAMAQWMIGESYFHQKEYEAALREYLRVEILYAYPTWQAGALLQAGKCHELLGQWQDATRVYERLVQSYPKTSFTEDSRRRLEAARTRLQAQAAR